MNSENTQAPSYTFSLTFNPEILRIIAYIALIVMFAVGYILTETMVHVDPHTTAIYRLFGVNHACNLLDHEPSRTVSAMILPFWEVPFLLYVIFNFLRINDAYREKKVPRGTYLVALIFFPIEVLLTVWFRIVFVWSPEVSFLNHYLPYIGFQILLCLTAFENALYFHAMNALPFNNNRTLANGYLVVLFLVTFVIVLIGLSTALGSPILDTVHDPRQLLIYESLDGLYFLLAVLMPMFLSWLELKRSPKHTLSVA